MSIFLVIISIISGILSGMGVGGGSIFILLSTTFCSLPRKEAMVYSLYMFLFTGISVAIKNYKNNSFDKKYLKKLVIPVCIGSIFGTLLLGMINEDTLNSLFLHFLLIIGIYEIISSLNSLKNTKNKSIIRKE